VVSASPGKPPGGQQPPPGAVEVRVVGDTVEISQDGKLFRVHPVNHDPIAFANPGGKPDWINAAS